MYMSSPQKINDHSFWAGGPGKDMVMPDGVKTKSVPNADGAGGMDRYEDTNEAIVAAQKMGKAKAEAHKMKPNYRN